MERRDFLKLTTATAAALAAQGGLPLLAAERGGRRAGPSNCFTEPCAVEPLTGYLPRFSPAAGKDMTGAFEARYALIACQGSAAASRNRVSGSLEVAFSGDRCTTTEKRDGRPANVVRNSVRCSGDAHAASDWTLASAVEGRPELGFVEKGSWNGSEMTVKAKSWTQRHATGHPLIARWALLPLLASGRLKGQPLHFDLLDDGTLRPGQILRYAGGIEIPLEGGTAHLDSYAQTGQAVVPTHYLVDRRGRVQLITMSQVNWALQDLQRHAVPPRP